MTAMAVKERIARLVDVMEAQGWDFVLATSPESVLYLSGALIHTQTLMRRRQCAVLVARDGAATLIVPTIEKDLAKRKSGLEELVTYNVFTQTACLAAAALLSASKAPQRIIALEKTHLPLFDFEDLTRHLPEARYADADDALRALRMIKSESEVAVMRFAANAMEEAIFQAIDEAHVGSREEEIAAKISQHMQHLGGGRVRSVTGLVAAGANLHTAHHIAADSQLQAGDVLRVGCRAVVEGYNGIVNRTAVVGECDPSTLDHYRRVHLAHSELIALLRPGMVSGDVYEHMATRYRQLELTPTNPHFGYATGLEFQEKPKLAPGATETLEAGMVILAESVSKDPRAGHIYIVDMVLIEPQQTLNLSQFRDISEPLVVRVG